MHGIVVPGIDGSGDTHWQTRWETSDPELERFAPSSWSAPDRDDWREALTRALRAQARDTGGAASVVIAHSLGCLAVIDALTAGTGTPVRAVLFVAPPDVDGPGFPAAAASFRGIRPVGLAVPTLVIASDDDPFSAPDASRAFAGALGAELVFVGARGHLNGASGLGDWPEGRRLLAEFLTERAAATAPAPRSTPR